MRIDGLLRSQVLRWGVTLVLVAFAFSKLNATQILEVTNLRGMCLLLACALTFASLVALNAVRWRLIAQILMLDIEWRRAFQWLFIGQFFNQILPSSIGGDVVRGTITARSTGQLSSSVISIALDRLVGLFALLTFVVLGQLLGARSIDLRLYKLSGTMILVGLILFAAALSVDKVFGQQYPLGFQRVASGVKLAVLNFARDMRQLFVRPSVLITVLALALVMQVVNLGIVQVIANQLGASVSFSEALLVIPTILLIASLPISVGGWGVRETGLALGFSMIGQSPSIAVETSIIIGLATLISSLPGALIWQMSALKNCSVAFPDADRLTAAPRKYLSAKAEGLVHPPASGDV
jgi:glycosyltransferase 2 family protein